MSGAYRSRPTQKGEAASTSLSHPGDTLSLPDAVDLLNGVHVLMVAYKVAGEIRYRRRFYLNLTAAQRAHDRAIQRGQAASIVLCKLAPARAYGGGWSL